MIILIDSEKSLHDEGCACVPCLKHRHAQLKSTGIINNLTEQEQRDLDQSIQTCIRFDDPANQSQAQRRAEATESVFDLIRKARLTQKTAKSIEQQRLDLFDLFDGSGMVRLGKWERLVIKHCYLKGTKDLSWKHIINRAYEDGDIQRKPTDFVIRRAVLKLEQYGIVKRSLNGPNAFKQLRFRPTALRHAIVKTHPEATCPGVRIRWRKQEIKDALV